jgi:peptide/nickel transport system permease protein
VKLHIYIIRRAFYSIPILLGVCLIIFLLFNFLAGDPTQVLLGKHATAEQMAEMRAQLGLDRPFYAQYFDLVKSVFTFDFGTSWSTKQDIFEMIKQGIGPSLSVSVPAFILSFVVSISLALVVAFYRGSMIDRFFVVFTVGLMSISSLAYILFFQWFFAYQLGWFEISGYEFGFPDFFPYVILPVIIWVILGVGPDIRFYRTILLDEIYQDYVRTARAKGLGERSIMFKHVLKNAMIQIITYVIIQIPFLILGALLLETFFSIPGLGGLVYNALNNNDFPVLRAMTAIIAFGVIIFNLIVDILYTVVDPRVRLQ